ncbi:MAG TPA: flagellar biosynthesis anti-sigma factor FlgM [Rectinemataceae bacterium]|nr:flagellar biosynthesis anti-sigma factor FlgM [Rectinemataceae bacterium]
MKPAQSGRADRSGKGDSISISNDASTKAELFRAAEIAKAAPEIRLDKVAELKAKINEPGYIDDAVLSMTADRIMDQLFEGS